MRQEGWQPTTCANEANEAIVPVMMRTRVTRDTTLQPGEIVGKAVWAYSGESARQVQVSAIGSEISTYVDTGGNFHLSRLSRDSVSLQARGMGLRVDTILVDTRTGAAVLIAMHWRCTR
ncbi:MAG: hypothetical protein JWO39_2302 [Gemmatimonadetes bacterium]|jgi:hypothetical protein|nr:hypothetical protein [Gemmatimonadota bacterium]